MNSPIKWHGGKSPYASWIVSLLPDRATWFHYVEPYFGGGSVLFAKQACGYSEVVNDRSLELSRFWKVLQSRELYGEFVRRVSLTPFSELEYALAAGSVATDVVDVAVALFVKARMGMAGRMKEFTPITRNRLRRDMNEQVAAYLSAVDGLDDVHDRLSRVLILEGHLALDVIAAQDGPHTVFYLDPPYLLETRVTTGEYGAYEMSDADHLALLRVLDSVRGRFLLSGYHSSLYDSFAVSRGWQCLEYTGASHAGSGASKATRVECIWRNWHD